MPTRDLSAIDSFCDGGMQGLSKIADGGVCGGGLKTDDQVIWGMAFIRLTVEFPNLSANPISNHRIPNTDRGRNADPPATDRLNRHDGQSRSCASATVFQNGRKLGAFPDSPVLAEACAFRRMPLAHTPPYVARLDGKLMATLGAAPLDHQSPAFRPHPDQEAMSPSSVAIVGLERSLHCFIESLPKVEPVILSVIRSGVKSDSF